MKIGKIVGVEYNRLRVKISSEIRGNAVNIAGQIYHFGNIGGFLKTTNAQEEIIFCEVVAIFDADAKKELKKESMSFDMESNRELILKPLGTISGEKFTLGVGIFPGLYGDVSIVTHDDMEKILNIDVDGADDEPSAGDDADNANGEAPADGGEVADGDEEKIKGEEHRSLFLGTSKNLINYPVEVGINRFFNIHSAVLGNTGSGKSNSIAHIVSQIHNKKGYSAMGSRIVLFDVNDEYKAAFKNEENKDIQIRYLKPVVDKDSPAQEDDFYLPHFLLSLDEWAAFLMATDATQKPFWNKVLQESYRFNKIATSNKDDEVTNYAHYIREKICSMIDSVISSKNSDTVNVLSALSLINGVLKIIERTNFPENAEINILKENIDALKATKEFKFGSNEDKLFNANEKVRESICSDKVKSVMDTKLSEGEYFNYDFLRPAADLVLLEEDARGNEQIKSYIATMMARLDYFLDKPYCEFMRATKSAKMAKIKSAKEYREYIWGKNQMVIIDTSQLPPDVLETLTSVVSRILFDERKGLSADDRRKNPIHLILDEAHRYIKKDDNYLLKENIFEKIAREGRKFSFYLMVSSQRPSELSQTVLSQCGNFIIHRIQNENDMRYIQAVLPYFSDDFVLKIKQSVPGEALVFGNCVPMPLHVKIEKANPEPSSKNCNVSKQWFIPESPASQQTSPSSADSPSNQPQEQPDDSSAEDGGDQEAEDYDDQEAEGYDDQEVEGGDDQEPEQERDPF